MHKDGEDDRVGDGEGAALRVADGVVVAVCVDTGVAANAAVAVVDGELVAVAVLTGEGDAGWCIIGEVVADGEGVIGAETIGISVGNVI